MSDAALTPAEPPPAPPRREGRYTLTLREIEDCPPPRSARLAALLGPAMLAGFLGWAAVFPVTERAIGAGEIAPIARLRPVQHADGGPVAEVLARPGQRVRAGDILVLMDGAAARAEAEAARARETALTLAAARLAAAAEGRIAELGPAPESAFAAIRDSQAAMAEAQARLRAAQLAVLEAELAARESAQEGLAALLEPLGQARDLAQEEVVAVGGLFERGLARRAELHALRQAALRGEADLARLRADLLHARLAAAETRARRDELAARARGEALAELARIEAELAETRAARLRAEARLARLAVVAPVAGLVKEIAPRGPGSVVEPGGLVAEIVPGEGGLEADVELPADRIGGVRPGQRAQVKVLAFDPSRFGSLAGEVAEVSPAAFRRQDGTPVFRVRVALAGTRLGDPALGLEATPGMSVSAEIATGQRSLLGWLARPVRHALDRAFSER